MLYDGRRSREGKRQSALYKVEAWPEHEEKYRINRLQYQKLAAELSAVMDPDPYNGTWGYPVYTLYFDDWDNRGYFDKADGLDGRERVRLRFYPSSRNNAMVESRAASKIFLEVKRRQADRRNKERLLIRAEEAQALLRGSSDFLDAYACGEARRIAQAVRNRPLHATALVAYRRRAFVHRMNGIRITLDEDIRCCPGSLIDENIGRMVSPYYMQGITGSDGWTRGKTDASRHAQGEIGGSSSAQGKTDDTRHIQGKTDGSGSAQEKTDGTRRAQRKTGGSGDAQGKINGTRHAQEKTGDIMCTHGMTGSTTHRKSTVGSADGLRDRKAPDSIYRAELPWIPLEMGEVLEVKYREYLFAWLRELLGRYPLIKGTCSKYMEAREHDGIFI